MTLHKEHVVWRWSLLSQAHTCSCHYMHSGIYVFMQKAISSNSCHSSEKLIAETVSQVGSPGLDMYLTPEGMHLKNAETGKSGVGSSLMNLLDERHHVVVPAEAIQPMVISRNWYRSLCTMSSVSTTRFHRASLPAVINHHLNLRHLAINFNLSFWQFMEWLRVVAKPASQCIFFSCTWLLNCRWSANIYAWWCIAKWITSRCTSWTVFPKCGHFFEILTNMCH